MEQCDLRISIPSLPLSSSPSPSSPSSSNHNSQPTFPLTVYRLNSTTELDPSTLTQRTRPARIAKLADIQPGTWLPDGYGESGSRPLSGDGDGKATLHSSDRPPSASSSSPHSNTSVSSNTTSSNALTIIPNTEPSPNPTTTSRRRTTYHRSFHCTREELYTFEIACSDVEVQLGGAGCAVEWWQDEEGVEVGNREKVMDGGGRERGAMVWVVQRQSD